MLKQIVSGGQTGVDRAALDVALERGLAVGGWCPYGRRAEDGAIPDRYPLQETSSKQYGVRTRLNVRDSDGTLVLAQGEPIGGTALTIACAEELAKPLIVVDLDMQPAAQPVVDWLRLHAVEVLNVAGPRDSTAPAAGRLAAEFLGTLLDTLAKGDPT